jgi:hypothetical protein
MAPAATQELRIVAFSAQSLRARPVRMQGYANKLHA